MAQSKVSVWILILTLSALLMACGGSSGSSDPQPQQPAPPAQPTPGDDTEPTDPGGGDEPDPEPGRDPEPEPEPITTPNSFSFAPQEGVTPGELVESNTITLTGITAPATISIANGEYKLDDGSFTAEVGHIEPGQSLTLRTTASDRADTTKETVVTVGGVAGRFIVHTMEDKEPPTASIIFPNVISASEQETLTIRGTAEDELSDVTPVAVFVNGLESANKIKSEDSFASWEIEVDLNEGAVNTITVSVEDEHGNVDEEAATVVVHQQDWDLAFPDDKNVFLEAEGITYDEKRRRVFISDASAHSVISVELATGKREQFYQGVPEIGSATGLAIDKAHDRLLVTSSSTNTIYSLNLEGELQPTVLSRNAHGDDSQPSLSSPMGIALDPENPDQAFVVGLNSKNLIAVNLITGQRTVVSDSDTPDDENAFFLPMDLLVDHNNNRALVGDKASASGRVVFSVDLETGERTVFSGVEVGGGDVEFWCPESLGSDRLSERILVGDCDTGIIAVDIATGERTLITEIIHRRANNHGVFIYVEEGWQFLFYVDARHRAVLMLDLKTDEYVIISKGDWVD